MGRYPFRAAPCAALLILAVTASDAAGQQRPPAKASAPTKAPPATPAAQDPTEAVQKALQAFVDAFNAGKPADAVALFAPAGVLVDEAAVPHQGQDVLTELLTGFLETYPGAKMSLETEDIRLIGPQLAVAETVRTVKRDETQDRAVTRAAVTFVLTDGQWKIAVVRDEPADDELTPHENLEPLAWLVGEWVNEESDSLIHLDCRWSEDQNYLLAAFTVKREGSDEMKSEMRIGWDPLERKIHSWVFDSDGGYGQGEWTRLENRWLLKSDAVLPNGSTGSATFMIEPDSADRFRMIGVDRVVGNDVQPDLETLLVRKPPNAGK